MENDPNTSSPEQISLYGLFGDSSTSLQGITDQLPPSILQQSPPCGSITYSSIYPSGVMSVVSPMKPSTNIQPRGLLLSDLAEHSPSAGSVTAATLCNHVSYDNLRCTNMVTFKGRRFCSQHSTQETLSSPLPSKTIVSVISPKTTLSQTISFVSPAMLQSTTSPVYSLPTLQNTTQTLAGKSVRTVRVDVKSLQSSILSKAGKDVTDGNKITGKKRSDISVPVLKPKPQIGQIVGNKIMVSAKIPTKKVVVNGVVRKTSPVTEPTTNKPDTKKTKLMIPQLQAISKPTALSAMKRSPQEMKRPMEFGAIKSSVASVTQANIARPITSFGSIKTIPVTPTQMQSNSSQTLSPESKLAQSTSSSTARPVGTATKPLQSLMIDESTLKTLLDVLNSQGDMTAQQQINLLRSLGITVVQAPLAPSVTSTELNKKRTNSKPSVQKKSSISKVRATKPHIPGANTESVVKVQLSNNVLVPRTDGQQDAAKIAPSLSGQFRTTAYEKMGPVLDQNRMQKKSLSNPVAMSIASDARVLTQSSKQVKRKKADTPNSVAKRRKTSPATPVSVADGSSNVSKQKTKPTKILSSKGKSSRPISTKNKIKTKQEPLKPSTIEFHPRRFPILLKELPPKPDLITLRTYARSFNSDMLDQHDLFKRCITNFESDSEEGITFEDDKESISRLLKNRARRKKKNNEEEDDELSLEGVPPYKFCHSLHTANRILRHLRKSQAGKSNRCEHHEAILDGLIHKFELNVKREIEDYEKTKLNTDEQWILDNEDLIKDDPEIKEKMNLAFTLSTERLRANHDESVKDLRKAENDISLLLQSYKENPLQTVKFLSSIFPEMDEKETSRRERFHYQQCVLSNNNGWTCSAPALPYALYCKQHIWHCPNQCLYKLDQNMRTVADIDPEPFVKKARKRPKLLPLIKRYKKKKRKKVQNPENNSTVREDGEIVITNMQSENVGRPTSCNDATVKAPDVKSSRARKISTSYMQSSELDRKMSIDHDDMRHLDTSEEDLNLTGQEIMMSGVFDKLPEDLNDFDLFTSDKGAEELERALLLAGASSPPPDSDKNESGDTLISPNKILKSLKSNKSSDLENVRMSPDVCVVLDAPHSSTTNETPPSLESFNQSQCVHYTFGSNFAAVNSKSHTAGSMGNNSLKEEGQISDNMQSPLSTQDIELQEIEGVLETLQKVEEEINSPLLPSSPAVDQYTSMLARQLSQEVETESKRLSTSRLCDSPKVSSMEISGSIMSDTQDEIVTSLTRTYSLPVPTMKSSRMLDSSQGNQTLPSNVNQTTNHAGASPIMSTTAPATSGMGLLSCTVSNSENVTKMYRSDHLDPLGLDVILPSLHDKPQFMENTNGAVSRNKAPMKHSLPQAPMMTSTPKKDTSKTEGKKQTSNRKIKKTSTKTTQALPASNNPRIPQRKLPQSQQTQAILSNQVLPLTLMQTQQQGGNIIKVIVPPGTVMNGNAGNAPGQQNMLLIPVNALVRSDVINTTNQGIPVGLSSPPPKNLAGQPVKTQLSTLQAGQQFLILNNTTGATQPHLTLVHKPTNVPGNPQTLLINPSTNTNTAMKTNAQAVGQSSQKVPTQKGPKQVLCNIKPNMNVYVNKTLNEFLARNRMAAMNKSAANNSPGKVTNSTASSTQSPTLSTTSPKLSNLNTSVSSTPHTDVLRSVKTPVKKQAKAKFDPITKKYVPAGTKLPSDVPVPPVPAPAPIGDTILKEKFDASTISSIQDKVQQINSVLSSLNSAAKNNPKNSQANNQSARKNQSGPKFVRSVTVPVMNKVTSSMILNPKPLAGTSFNKTLPVNVKPAPVTVAMSTSPSMTSSEMGSNSIKISLGQKTSDANSLLQRPDPHPTVNLKTSSKSYFSVTKNQSNQELQKQIQLSAVAKPNAPPSTTPVSTGTVHWNQTTTEGPEVTPSITVPVYITAGKWPPELSLNGSLSRSIIFPSRKISPNYQLPQRVILGNIGSLGVLTSKNDAPSNPPTITISAYTQLSKPVKSDLFSNSTSKPLNSIPQGIGQGKNNSATNVTAVMGTTMSPKLSPLTKDACPDRFTPVDPQSLVRGSQILSSHPPLSNPAYVVSVKSQDTPSDNLKQEATATEGTLAPPTSLTASLLTTNASNSSLVDINGNHKQGCTGGKLSRKKCARKASHDTILHDPLMYDPTTLDAVPGDNAD